MLGAAILAATFTITIPPAVTADMAVACARLVQDFRGAGDTTDEECILKLVQQGLAKALIATERKVGQDNVESKRQNYFGNFPNPMRAGVCGNGVIDGGEECDGGPNCLPNCRNKPGP